MGQIESLTLGYVHTARLAQFLIFDWIIPWHLCKSTYSCSEIWVILSNFVHIHCLMCFEWICFVHFFIVYCHSLWETITCPLRHFLMLCHGTVGIKKSCIYQRIFFCICLPFFIHIRQRNENMLDLNLTHLRNAMYKLFMDLWAKFWNNEYEFNCEVTETISLLPSEAAPRACTTVAGRQQKPTPYHTPMFFSRSMVLGRNFTFNTQKIRQR